ncbi:limonene-1,2-epoxide hydrolase family protein [Streptomyces canus]|uniref:limonene-1,2-epoxide hydrolase family protein n=2 Tax=Streptomyces canus TaxID=58343 RepID=UPI002E25578C
MMSTNTTLVSEFCDLMVKRDAEVLRRFFTADAVYHNVGMPPAVGVDAIVENLAQQMTAFPDSYEYRMVNLAGDGDVVLTERVDMIRTPDGIKHGVPVMGTFVITGGKISRWTDYFDTALLVKMNTGEDYSALVPQSS